jgi:hypothetical protein
MLNDDDNCMMNDLLLVFLVEKCGMFKSTEYEEAKQRIEIRTEKRKFEP